MTSARYHVIHETRYVYENPVSVSRQQLHLTPRDCPWQTCLGHRIDIDPEPGLDETRFDSFGNPVRQFTLESPHSKLVVRAESRIEVRSHLPEDAFGRRRAADISEANEQYLILITHNQQIIITKKNQLTGILQSIRSTIVQRYD